MGDFIVCKVAEVFTGMCGYISLQYEVLGEYLAFFFGIQAFLIDYSQASDYYKAQSISIYQDLQ